MTKFISLISIINIFVSCQNKIESCDINKVELLNFDCVWTIEDTSYQHVLFIENYKSECLDSTKICKFIKNYVDTVQYGKPIGAIFLHNSLEYYSDDEISQVGEFDRSLILVISINRDKSIRNFARYDENGDKFIETLEFPKARKYN